MKDKIFVFGASGHAKAVIDIIEQQGLYKVVLLADDDTTLKDTVVYGYSVIGGKTELLESEIRRGVVAIGCNKARRSVTSWLTDNGFELISAIHPVAQLARGVSIGDGTVIMAGAVINSDASVGNGVIINTRTCVDHDCTIGDFCHIAPGVTICGTVSIGQRTLISAGVTIGPNVCIGSDVVIGAGSTVLNNIPNHSFAVGTPAKVLKKRS
ncbi:MAG: acetyltransferase [Dissulfurispiraceae bacterium]|jgi:sugar O-acyltransferase (sialic acid O-acetyltransferase NeuD family)|nr:acetyltransferase [Dissulfurispiraceae bacterium]